MLVPDSRFSLPQTFNGSVSPSGVVRTVPDIGGPDFDVLFNNGQGNVVQPYPLSLPPMKATTPIWGEDTRGTYAKFDDSNNNAYGLSGYAPIVTSDGAGTGDFTIIVSGYFVKELVPGYVFSQRSWVDTLKKAEVIINYNGSGNPGYIVFYAGYKYVVSDSTALPSSGFYVYGFTRIGSKLYIYRDGKIVATNDPGSVTSITGSTDNEAKIGAHATYSSSRLRGNIYRLSSFNRALSNDEMMQYSLNPFKCLHPV